MANQTQKIKVEISYKTIVFSVAFLLGLYLVYLLKDLLMGLFISVLFATGLHPAVSSLERLRIPRPLAILLVYVIIVMSVVLLVANIVPPLLTQTENLIQSLPVGYISEQFQSLEVSLENLQFITDRIGTVGPILKIVLSTFSGLITFVTFSVITFYLLMERKDLHKHITTLSPNIESEHKAEALVDKIETKIGSWVRGQLILMLVIGLTTYVGLTLLGISYALPLAILAGLLEIIPNIGPTIAAVPAIIVPILVDQNPLMALFVLAFYVLIQQLENNLLVPRIMRSAVGLHPLVTIISIIIGLRLSGVTGAILAVPIFLVTKVLFEELVWPNLKKNI